MALFKYLQITFLVNITIFRPLVMYSTNGSICYKPLDTIEEFTVYQAKVRDKKLVWEQTQHARQEVAYLHAYREELLAPPPESTIAIMSSQVRNNYLSVHSNSMNRDNNDNLRWLHLMRLGNTMNGVGYE